MKEPHEKVSWQILSLKDKQNKEKKLRDNFNEFFFSSL